MVDVVSVLVSVLVGLIAAFAGVVLGTHYERKRAKAESLYEVKRSMYMELTRTVDEISSLVEDTVSLQALNISEMDEFSVGLINRFRFAAHLCPRDTAQELQKELEQLLSPQGSKKSSVAILESIRERIFAEALFRVTELTMEFWRKFRTLEFVDVPEDVEESIEMVGKYLGSRSIFEPVLDIVDMAKGEYSMSKLMSGWGESISSEAVEMKQRMRNDLERAL